MTFRNFLSFLEKKRVLQYVTAPVSKNLEAAAILDHLKSKPVLFSNIKESTYKTAGNFFTSKEVIAQYFNREPGDLIPFMVNALRRPTSPEKVNAAPCQEFTCHTTDLDQLPILRHNTGDGGNYISSGVFVAAHPKWGQNLDFHRCMQISQTEFTVRIVKNRHFDQYLKEQKSMPVAVCIGVSPGILLAAATSVDIGVDELSIANSLEPFHIVKAKTADLWIPADSEFVIEGIIHFDRTVPEGPFVDLTGTYDVIREQPVMEVTAITHRAEPIWHALIPGGSEHKTLMGMPREPTIYQKVNEVAECLDVNITPGGASWLHAVVQIRKHSEPDGKNAILAAFEGHRSCKHVFIVDEDINIYDPDQVEWAMATRFQGDTDLIIKKPEQGSSLDPSADPGNHFTTKIGFDLTKPVISRGKNYSRAHFPDIDINRYGIGEKDS